MSKLDRMTDVRIDRLLDKERKYEQLQLQLGELRKKLRKCLHSSPASGLPTLVSPLSVKRQDRKKSPKADRSLGLVESC
jgi:hypothetical protein